MVSKIKNVICEDADGQLIVNDKILCDLKEVTAENTLESEKIEVIGRTINDNEHYKMGVFKLIKPRHLDSEVINCLQYESPIIEIKINKGIFTYVKLDDLELVKILTNNIECNRMKFEFENFDLK